MRKKGQEGPRLPASGVVVGSIVDKDGAMIEVGGRKVPLAMRDIGDLEAVLAELVNDEFAASNVDDVRSRLGHIVGGSVKDHERLYVAEVANALQDTIDHLTEASQFLSGGETGMHSALEITVAGLIAAEIANPDRPGSVWEAHKVIAAFCAEAKRMADMCSLARDHLPDLPAKVGRPPAAWFDDFTALLMEIAHVGGVEPTLSKKWGSEDPCGWMAEAALALEPFLHPDMRFQSPSALGKRLERSIQRIAVPNDKTPSDGE